MFYLLQVGRRVVVKEFTAAKYAHAFVAARKRNGTPAMVCEEIDPEDCENCSGVTGDPRHTGRWCACSV